MLGDLPVNSRNLSLIGDKMAAPSRRASPRNSLEMIAARRSPVRVRLAPSEVPANALLGRRRGARCGWPHPASQLSVNFTSGGAARGEGRDPRQGGLQWDRAAPGAFESSAASTASRMASTRSAGATRAGCASGPSGSTFCRGAARTAVTYRTRPPTGVGWNGRLLSSLGRLRCLFERSRLRGSVEIWRQRSGGET